MRVLGINAVFHDPAAALVVDGRTVCAVEEERLSRRKHGKRPVPFAAWELPEQAAWWCLAEAGLRPEHIDAVAYSFDPKLCRSPETLGLHDPWEWLRKEYAVRAPRFLSSTLPGLDPDVVEYVPHHVAHAASAALAAPAHRGGRDRAVLVLDGRGESTSHLAGVYRDGKLEILATQSLPHSLGLLYEQVTEYLGFQRSSDEYKVMALASYGTPKYLDQFRENVYATPDGGFRTLPMALETLCPPQERDAPDWLPEHADLAASVQCRLQEVLLDLANGASVAECVSEAVAAASRYVAGGGPQSLAYQLEEAQ